MKFFLVSIVLAVAFLLVVVVVGQEIHTLTTPITKPNQTTIRIERFTIDVITKTITIQWIGNNGEAGTATYPTPSPNAQPSGATLLTSLNKMNFSGGNPSLVARVINRLALDGYIPAGTTSGTPE